MKNRIWLLLTILLLLSLAACQSPAPTVQTVEAVGTEGVASTEYPAPAEQPASQTQAPEALTAENQPYPAQGAEAQTQPQAQSAPAYPASGEAETIEWAEAQEIILSGVVLEIYQAGSLQVTLTLNDGRSVVTTQPAYGDVIRVKESCGEKCSPIQIFSDPQQ